DWVVHGLGRLYPGNPAAYRPSLDLIPHYGWVDRERSRAFDGSWQADWVQSRAGILEREGKRPKARRASESPCSVLRGLVSTLVRVRSSMGRHIIGSTATPSPVARSSSSGERQRPRHTLPFTNPTRTVTLRIKARVGLPNDLFEVSSEPVDGTPAATET